ncbi:MAG: thiamine pyrophosphate-binding protein [Proteobacteria bacterium]|nr:thiamine pyrophosphate-binding protein [Pseudomonadota bacterium]
MPIDPRAAPAPSVSAAAPRTAARALVDCLIAQEVPIAFAVAGESYLAVLDALYDVRERLPLVTCRHEAGAANMAEAVGKLTGRPGVCFVTRGPGATHASIAVHTAQQDATPLVLFVGQVARQDLGRDAFQEIDFGAMFGSIAKWVVEVHEPERMSELVTRAFAIALNGRPGPVVVSLPEDVLEEPCTLPAGPRIERIATPLEPAVTREIAHRLRGAARPLCWVGGSGWTEAGTEALRHFAERWRLPVATGFRRKDLFPNDHPSYVGEFGFAAGSGAMRALSEADLVLALGTNLCDVETGGYTRLDPRTSVTHVVHVAMRPEDAGRVFPVALRASASPDAAALALAQEPPPAAPAWAAWSAAARDAYVRDLEPVPVTGAVNPSEVLRELRRRLPDDAIVANGAGNYAAWLHRFFEHRRFRTQLAPQSGAMGYGVPAAIAAALLHPGRRVVAVAGDGCFMMSANELVTAAATGARVLFLVFNNGSFGTIRMHQETRFPGRVHATELVNPDFVALAQACGVGAERVAHTEDFAAALASALAAAGPRLIELVTSVEDIAPGRRLSALAARRA